PFASTGFFAPPLPSDLTGRPDVRERATGVNAFWWPLHECFRAELLPFVFADAEDERNQYTMVIHQVAARLRMDAIPAGTDGAVTIDGGPGGTSDQLVDPKAAKPAGDDTRSAWAGPVTGAGTVNAFLRRLRSSLRALRPLIRGDLPETASR